MKNNIWALLRIYIYIGIFIAVFLCYKGYFFIKCSFVEEYGIICPACGATRATLSLTKGNLPLALYYNSFYTLVILPAFLIFVLEDIYVIIKRSITKKTSISLIEVLLGGAND